MPINTADKRRSAASTLPWRRISPLPSTTAFDNNDRLHIAGHYRAILPDEIFPTTFGIEVRVMEIRPHFVNRDNRPHAHLRGETRPHFRVLEP